MTQGLTMKNRDKDVKWSDWNGTFVLRQIENNKNIQISTHIIKRPLPVQWTSFHSWFRESITRICQLMINTTFLNILKHKTAKQWCIWNIIYCFNGLFQTYHYINCLSNAEGKSREYYAFLIANNSISPEIHK